MESILSISRRDTSHTPSSDDNDQVLELFQKHVTDLFQSLHSSSDVELLSLSWIRNLLNAFLICLEEFGHILFNFKHLLHKPPIEKLINDFFDRAIKSLDICNAVRDGIDMIMQWCNHIKIVLSSFSNNPAFGEGHLKRARKALAELANSMSDEKDSTSGSILSHRSKSFGRNSVNTPRQSRKELFRSQSWSVSRTWSASKSLQAIASNLSVPRGNEITQTHGLAVPVYTMSVVLAFVIWALVAAIPCQDRGIVQVHLPVGRNLLWGSAMVGMQERIVEEGKRKERKGSNGLMKEVYRMERCVRGLMEVVETVHVPMMEEMGAELGEKVREMEGVCGGLRGELEGLERQVREVFVRIVTCRMEGLDCMARNRVGE